MNSDVQTIICPNCGKKLTAVKDSDGGARMQCGRCGILIYSKTITPKHIKLDIKVS